MGSPAIWWYPQDVLGRLQALTLERPVTDLLDLSRVYATAERGLDGAVFVERTSEEIRIRLTYETDDAEEARILANIATHLQRGGMIAFALDTTKAWAGYTREGLRENARILRTRGNTWRYGSQNSSAALADGDQVAIAAPGEIPQLAVVSGAPSGDAVTIASPGLLRNLEREPWLFVRHPDYYPALVLPPDAIESGIQPLTSDRRILWTFEAELIEDVRSIANMSGESPGVLGETGGYGRSSPRGTAPYPRGGGSGFGIRS